MIVKNSDLPVRKRYKCYRRTVKKLLKLSVKKNED